MRLRNRAQNDQKSASTSRQVDYDNEEDVDDPADDSDCDPEWDDTLGKGDSANARKRKSFMPLQMQDDKSKVRLLGESSGEETYSSNSEDEDDSLKSSVRKKKIINSRSAQVNKQAKAKDSSAKKIQSTSKVHAMLKPQSATTSTTCSSLVKVLPKSSGQVKKEPEGISKNATITQSGITSSYNGYKSSIQTMVVKDSRCVTSIPFKILKKDPATSSASSKTNAVLTPTPFSNGDFLKDISTKGNKNCIWQVDGMNLLQKFVPSVDDKTGMTLYKSSFTYDGLNAMNTPKFQKVSAVIVNKIKNITYVKLNEELNPLEVEAKVKVEPKIDDEVVTVEPTTIPTSAAAAPSQKPAAQPVPVIPDTPSIANYKNTFKDEFTVFLQALISQCLDISFLRTVYTDQDAYFIDKIKAIDDVLEAKKFSLMSLPSFPNNDRILYAIHTYPVIEEKQLPAIKMENLNCVVCVEQGVHTTPACSSVCLELTGEPYERNTLIHVKLLVDVDEDLKVLRVCTNCSKILRLYSKMCHSKYLIYKQCEKSVQKILEKQQAEMDASEVIISLLNNEPWCETKLLQIIRDWILVDDLKRET